MPKGNLLAELSEGDQRRLAFEDAQRTIANMTDEEIAEERAAVEEANRQLEQLENDQDTRARQASRELHYEVFGG